MKLGHIVTLLAVFCFGMATFAGCGTPSDTTASHDDHGHDHDHGDHDHDHDHGDHDHGDSDLPAHGPNNGHLFRLEGSELVGEWIHYNDNDIIRVILLDEKHQNAVSCDGVTIAPTAGDDKTPFELELDPDKNPAEKKFVYMIDDKMVCNAMTMGVEVEFTVGDKKIKGKIAPHAPHDH